MTTRDMDVSSVEELLGKLRALPQTATRDQAIRKVEQQLRIATAGAKSAGRSLGSGDRFRKFSGRP